MVQPAVNRSIGQDPKRRCRGETWTPAAVCAPVRWRKMEGTGIDWGITPRAGARNAESLLIMGHHETGVAVCVQHKGSRVCFYVRHII